MSGRPPGHSPRGGSPTPRQRVWPLPSPWVRPEPRQRCQSSQLERRHSGRRRWGRVPGPPPSCCASSPAVARALAASISIPSWRSSRTTPTSRWLPVPGARTTSPSSSRTRRAFRTTWCSRHSGGSWGYREPAAPATRIRGGPVPMPPSTASRSTGPPRTGVSPGPLSVSPLSGRHGGPLTSPGSPPWRGAARRAGRRGTWCPRPPRTPRRCGPPAP